MTKYQRLPALASDYAVAPGATLADLLQERRLTQAELARRTGLSPKHVNQVISGGAPISADVALRLERALGTPANFWLRREADYQIDQARLAARTATASDLSWIKQFPVNALAKLGVLPQGPSDPVSRLQQLLSFFAVVDRDAYDEVWRGAVGAFRQSAAFESKHHAVTAWLRLGELEAQKMVVGDFDKDRFEAVGAAVREASRLTPRLGLQRMQDFCAGAGVILVFVAELPNTRTYGATRWIHGNTTPLIQLSVRGRREDQLWHTLLHESVHVLRHPRRSLFVDDLQEDQPDATGTSAQEAEAERGALEFAIPNEFLAELPSLETERDVLDFADRVGVSASLVVYRLHRERLWDFNRGSRLRRPVLLSELPGSDGASELEAPAVPNRDDWRAPGQD